MESQVQYRKGQVRIRGEMTVYGVAELKASLQKVFDRHPQAALLDLSEVAEIDTAGLQLLLAARKSAQARGVTLSLIEPSAAVADMLQLCQLTALCAPPAAET